MYVHIENKFLLQQQVFSNCCCFSKWFSVRCSYLSGSGIRVLMLFKWKTSSWACLFCFSLTYNVSGDLSSLMECFSFLCAVSVSGKHCLIPCHFWMLSPWEFASADSRVHSDDVWTVWPQDLDFQSPLPVQIWLIAFLTKCFQKYL